MNSRWMVIIVAVFVLDRLLILQSGLPLLFDINEAEYSHYRVLNAYWTTPLQNIWTSDLQAFSKEVQTIANQPHGSVAYSASFLLWISQLGHLPMSTWTLKMAALTHSAMALLGWLLLLKREKATLLGSACFVVLSICSAVVPLKLSMLYWGTHDMAIFLLPWLLLCCRWMSVRTSFWRIGIGSCFLAFGAIFQLSLLPALACGSLYIGHRAYQNKHWWSLTVFPVLIVGVWQLLHHTALIEALQLPNPLLFGEDVGLRSTQRSWDIPSAFYWSGNDTEWTMPLLGGAIAWGLWCSKSSHERLYLLLPVIGLLCVVVLGQTLIVFEQQPIGVLPRYQALYYTPTIAALSLLATRSRSISVFLLLLSAWAILHHHFWFSPETSSQHRGYDGVALYYFGNGEEVPPNRGIAFAEESEDFLRGYSVVQRLQYRSYWHFWWPAQQPRLPISQVVTAHRFFHLSQIEDSNDFSRGVQSAVRLWTSKGQSRD